MRSSVRGKLLTIALVSIASLVLAAVTFAGHVGPGATGGTDVKVTDDNGNADGGLANTTPSKDARNRQANETTIAISPVNPNIVAAAANDYRMVPHFADAWVPVYLSFDGGTTWFGSPPSPSGFNTMVPGFPTDTSAAGLSSPIHGLDGAGDPVIRFDGSGNLYVGGLASNRTFQQPERPLDNAVFVAKYMYTPGTSATASTTTSAGSPPNFTYAFTTIVDRGAVGFAIPNQPFGFAGQFVDKNWMAIDTNASSPCAGNVYYSYTKFTGLAGAFPIVVARSTDGGATFSQPKAVSTGGREGTVSTQGSNIAVAPNGTVHVSYRTFATSSDPTTKVQVVRSTDCGKHFGNPITAAVLNPMPRQAAGLTFRTPLESWVAVDDTNSDTVYVAYMALAGTPENADIFVARSMNGGLTWGSPAKVNDDTTKKHQFWPAIDVSNGDLHVAWYDFRDSPTPGDPAATNSVLNVYYASSNTTGVAYPAFGHNVKVTDVGHNPNCLMFGGGTVGFHGDYIELAARYDTAISKHKVHVAWADNRDVSPCNLTPGIPTNSTGNRNQNVYADTLLVTP